MLLVATATSVEKQGVRNEIQIAHSIGQKIKDSEFIIPLRLESFEPPFLIAHAQYIDFSESWGSGFVELLDALEAASAVVRSRDEKQSQLWKSQLTARGREIKRIPELTVSNWLELNQLPKLVHRGVFKVGVSEEVQNEVLVNFEWPCARYGEGFITFASAAQIQSSLSAGVPFEIDGRISTTAFRESGCANWGLQPTDARNFFSSLLRQAVERHLESTGLKKHQVSGGEIVWWFPLENDDFPMIKFAWPDAELSGRRQIYGFSNKRQVYWHYGVSLRIRLWPVTHLTAVQRVVFTKDGHEPIPDTLTAHRLRRSFTRSWRNPRWRDMVLAFLWKAFEEKSQCDIDVGGGTVGIAVPPLLFEAPISVGADDHAEEHGSGEEDDEDYEPDDEEGL